MEEKNNPFEPYERLEKLKTDFIKVNLEIDDVHTQLRMLQGRLKVLETERTKIKDAMTDICGRTGLTIYERSEEE